MAKERIRRKETPAPPMGKEKLKWYGPGFVWMISAVGSGAVLFTPRVGARYGYDFVWLALIFFFLMYVMIREVGRYTVVTGQTIFRGYRDLSGSSSWALYFILIPAIIACVVTVSGIASLASSALMIVASWSHAAYATVLIVACLILILVGGYQQFEKVLTILAGVLVVVIFVSGIKVLSSTDEFVTGLVPSFPAETDFSFIIPWVGFLLAGASGIMWFSYWIAAREFGGSLTKGEDVTEVSNEEDQSSNKVYDRLRLWMKTLSTTALIGVVGGGLILLAFLVLGVELLKPKGVVPEGVDVAEDLAKLLSEVWGEIGKWLLVIGMLIALVGTMVMDECLLMG